MGKYRIILVDDEEEIRFGIIKKIEWEKYGFEVVGDAENGKEALEKAEKLKPDIIITDIKMPFMDGLTLAEKVNEVLPLTKIIILSGFDDFEYAKRAIKMNVVEYILKPINSQELIETIKKLKITLDKEKEERRDIDSLKKYYSESLPILKNQFFIGLIEDTLTNEEILLEATRLNVNFESDYFVVACIKQVSDKKDKNIFQGQEQLIPISIQKIIDDKLDSDKNTMNLIYHKEVVIIRKLSDEDEVLDFIKELNNLCDYYQYTIGLQLTIGVGNVINSINQISNSYKTAQNAISYRFILGSGKAIYIRDVESEKNIELHVNEQEERILIEAIKTTDEKNIQLIIENMFKRIEDLYLHFSRYRIYLLELMIKLLKLVQSYKIDEKELWGENFNLYEKNEEFTTLKEGEDWIIQNAIQINKLINKERLNSTKILIDKAKLYIEDNFNDSELSVEKICSNLHVSQTYFSTIFKKETSMGFVNYLTRVRLEEAIKLLKTTDDKTYIIANKVGYPEANYFSYVFKRKYGVSPSKYRKNK